MSLQNDLQTASKSIEELIKKTITNKGLVKTGTLRDSITASVSIDANSGAMSIKVEGEDYFEYLDEQHNIVEDAFASSDFAKIEDELGNAYVTFLEDKLKN